MRTLLSALPILLLFTACDALSSALLTELTIEERREICLEMEIPVKDVDCDSRTATVGLRPEDCEVSTLERSPVNPACEATVDDWRTCKQLNYEEPCVSGHDACRVLNGCFAQ